MNALRIVAFAIGLAGLALRLCVPVADVCWHRDGRICDEAMPRSCCDGGQGADPAGEGCRDCTDFHLEPVTSTRAAAASSPPDAGAAGLCAPPLSGALPLDSGRAREIAPGSGPPPGALAIPLRC